MQPVIPNPVARIWRTAVRDLLLNPVRARFSRAEQAMPFRGFNP